MTLEASEPALEQGDTAPDFSLPGVDGETHSLSDYDDHEAVLVVFTCNHCPYAQAKFEALNAIAEEYDDVAVIGINPNDAEEYPEDSFEQMQAFVERGEIRYDAYLRDESQDVAEAYGAVCTPDPFLLRYDEDRDEFVLAYHGRLDDALSPDEEPSEEPGFEVREAIESVLAGEEVDQSFRPSQGCSIKWTSED
ncbi:thioredoxin family protein [Halospeciosus flavus]|uniref:Thioredoxin family protein n=1 Tax=Halospeciosus flavus TaxID=3032283 RepID=A0ABD5Z5E6_9EURY|nr:thioredoxin family protein [Halospeciosus flavus]